MKSLLALLFCIGALVASTAAQLLYKQLPEQHRRAIDRTVEDFNSNQRKAFSFYELIDPVKETEPRMDCVGCFIAGSDHFEEEFIDCVQRNQVTKKIQNKRAEECDKLHPYHLGGMIALASSV
ncbi:uncharacterized protein LOC117972384 isoform X2 [Acipenser ruthenus]|uniref:uncharacterized protein LOC117972384 isoform X2 n=1 Tax=Acipenser ruthenus TaxID=7906 RepID=UPI00145B7B2D|nr:uncharacterized protein LOC117972384 isoform X2 [Acipenser ruthenus]